MCTDAPENLRLVYMQRRPLFRLAPFLLSGDGAEVFKARAENLSRWVIVSTWEGEATVRTLRGSVEMASRAAIEAARSTGDPTILGLHVGIGPDGLPRYETHGYVKTAKADPLSPNAYDAWVRRIAQRLYRISDPEAGKKLKAAIEVLLRDYPQGSPEQVENALEVFRSIVRSPRGEIMRMEEIELRNLLAQLIHQTGRAVQNLPGFRARLATGFSVVPERAARLLARHHSYWVRDQAGRIAPELSAQARAILEEGFRDGIGRKELADDLGRRLGPGFRDAGYWETVASTLVGRARSYALGASMRGAGIEYFRIDAIIDDRTTQTCRYLDGKIMPVGSALANDEAILLANTPESVFWRHPMIQDRGDRLVVEYPDKTSRIVAEITSRDRDVRAADRFIPRMDQAQMVSAGIGFPPYHYKCRTTVVPIF